MAARLGADVPVLATSSATGAGLRELAGLLLRLVPRALRCRGRTARAKHRRARRRARSWPSTWCFAAAGSGFQVERSGEARSPLRGRGIERLLARYDIENEDAMAYLEGRLRRIGVLSALEAEGFQPGDEIEIAGVAFELDPRSVGESLELARRRRRADSKAAH